MLYSKELIIQAYDLLLGNELEEWAVGCVSPEEYFELRILQVHHHCPCKSEDALSVMNHFTKKGMVVSLYHKPGSDGILFIKENIDFQ